MICDCLFHRRGLFKFGAGLAAAAGLMRFEARAQAPAATTDKSNAGGAQPARGEYVLRGGHVLTMDESLGDFPAGDVHVRDGAIVAVGAAINAPGAQIIEARDMIVMPGFVDTHWHLWCTSLRMAIRADDPKEGYFPTTIRVGRFLNPQDSYAGVRLGLAEGLLSGITTVHNFSHNTVSPAHADAEVQAMTDLGVRGRFSYGSVQGLPADQAMNIDDVARVQKQWTHADGMLNIGANLRTPGPAGTRGSIPVDMFRREFDAFRKLGVPMTLHCGPKNLVALMGANGLLGSDMLMVHPQGMSAAELRMIGDARSPWSAAPVIEMSYSAVRNGTIQNNELAEMALPLGLSIDASAATNADFFNVMRALMWSDWQRNGAPQRLKPRRLVELATIEGAKVLGLGDKTGSLTPGKRADVIAVRKTDINMAPVGDPYYALVFQGQPGNVDTVMVDGRILARGGKLTSVDVSKTVREAEQSARGIIERAARG